MGEPRVLVRALNESRVLRNISALNEAFDPDQEWFRLAPYGDFPVTVADPKTGRLRRVIQRVDETSADEIARSFNSVLERIANGFRGLPIYVGHVDDPEWLKANPGAKKEAVGRIREVQKRSDGIWARRALNDEGRRLLTGDGAPYDAHSPHWGMIEIAKGVFRPVELYSTALTNTPNIPGNAIGLNEAETAADHSFAMKPQLIALLAALGRPISNPSAVTDEQLVAAANEAVPVATQFVAAANELATVKPQLATAQTQLTTASNETASLRTELQKERTARADLVLTSAINEGRITQAQRAEWHGKLTATGADFDAVATQLHTLKKAINTKNNVADIGGRKSEAVSSDKITAINEAVAAKKQAGLSHDDAYAAVRREKPDLFSNAGE